jgi:hypothetical protein
MAFRMSPVLQNDLCNAVVDMVAGAGGSAGTGRLRIYTGTQPATPLTSPSGTLLVEIHDICWGYAFTEVPSHSATFDVDGGGTTGTITAAGSPYALIKAGCVIVVTGTDDNDGMYEVSNVATDNVITVNTVIAGTDGVKGTTVISPPVALRAQLVDPDGYAHVAVDDGEAGWARLTDSAGDGSYVIDGDVGESSANVFTINVDDIVSGGTITLLNADIYMA